MEKRVAEGLKLHDELIKYGMVDHANMIQMGMSSSKMLLAMAKESLEKQEALNAETKNADSASG